MEVTPSPAEAPAVAGGVVAADSAVAGGVVAADSAVADSAAVDEAAVADAASTSVAAVAATVAVVAVVAPVVASAHLGPWIFVCDAGDVNCGGGRSAHVIQWDKCRRKPTPNGVFGWASCLASFPPDQALPTDGFRLHVCCQNPCPVKHFHPGKFGNLPPPRAHGRFVAAASEGLVEEDLVRYVELLSGVPPPPLPPPPLPEQPPPAAAAIGRAWPSRGCGRRANGRTSAGAGTPCGCGEPRGHRGCGRSCRRGLRGCGGRSSLGCG